MSGRGGKREGAGRPKGSPNKVNSDVKEMILGALEDVGGRAYLAQQAIESPAAFLSLLGKVLPTTITGNLDVKSYVVRAPAPVESAGAWLALYAPSAAKEIYGEAESPPTESP